MSEILEYIPEKNDLDRVQEALEKFNLEIGAPKQDKKNVALKFLDGEKILGEVTSEVSGERFHVNMLHVEKSSRKSGIGRQLMEKIEKTALSMNCKFITVYTLSWMAEGFYERLGYEEFARFGLDTPNCFNNVKQYRIFYRKALS